MCPRVSVGAVSSRRAPSLLALVSLCLLAGPLLTGCGSSDRATPAASPTGSAAATSAGGSAEPGPALAQASQEAAAQPARATDVRSAALAVALRSSDLPPRWSVQANPLPDGSLADNPSLAGICGATFASEGHRTVKYPVTGLDPDGTPLVVSESIGYDSPAAAASALDELRAAFRGCSPEDRTILPAPRVDGLVPGAVVVEYELAGGTRQEVIAQARGAVVSVLIGEDPAVTGSAARSIAGRLAALPAAAVGG